MVLRAPVVSVAVGKRFVVSSRCKRTCNCNEANLPFADELLGWFNERRSYTYIIASAESRGKHLTLGGLSRHRRHLDYATDEQDAQLEAQEEIKVDSTADHLKVLQLIIKQGAKKASTWRIGPAETLKAMDMYYKLTQGSIMQDLFGALAAAASGDETVTELDTLDVGSLSPAELEGVDADNDGG
jgi:hypothetical protein